MTRVGVVGDRRRRWVGAAAAFLLLAAMPGVASALPPPTANDDTTTVDEGGSVTIDVTANDRDPDSDHLIAHVEDPASHGTLTPLADGSGFVYDHLGSETTTDSFTYFVDDDDGNPNTVSNRATVTITINPVNDAPVARNDTAEVDAGGTVDIDVLANDTDAEGHALEPVVLAQPTDGTAMVRADGRISYTHDAGSTATSDSFTYRVTDELGANSGSAVVEITIIPGNLPPDAVDDTALVVEGGTHSGNVLMNDSDPDGDDLTAELGTGPSNGDLTLDPTTGDYTYVHDGSDTSTDSFTYRAVDPEGLADTATVTLTITPTNDAPVTTPDTVTVDEGGSVTGNVLDNDFDPEGEALIAELVTEPLRGTVTVNSDGLFAYQHDGSESSTDTFEYVATDGKTDSPATTVTITIEPVNDAPVAVDDEVAVAVGASVSGNVLDNDIDADGDTLTARLVKGPSSGTLEFATDGSYTYAAGNGNDTSDSFLYVASDGTVESDLATVNIDLTGVLSGGAFQAIVLGGPGVVSETVVDELETLTGAAVVRLEGTDRYGTAAAISAATFAVGVAVAYVAVGTNFPDALAGGAAAAVDGGPILLVKTDVLPAATAQELARLDPARIVILGGEGVVSAGVAMKLEAYTDGPVERLAGNDRFETAVAVSQYSHPNGAATVYVAVGTSFPDALAGVPAAVADGAPILLVNESSVPSATRNELIRLGPTQIIVLGGPGAVTSAALTQLENATGASVTRLAGANRYDTAAEVSAATFDNVSRVFIATGLDFPDALAGVSPAAIAEAPILLVENGSVPAGTSAEIRRLAT